MPNPSGTAMPALRVTSSKRALPRFLNSRWPGALGKAGSTDPPSTQNTSSSPSWSKSINPTPPVSISGIRNLPVDPAEWTKPRPEPGGMRSNHRAAGGEAAMDAEGAGDGALTGWGASGRHETRRRAAIGRKSGAGEPDLSHVLDAAGLMGERGLAAGRGPRGRRGLRDGGHRGSIVPRPCRQGLAGGARAGGMRRAGRG